MHAQSTRSEKPYVELYEAGNPATGECWITVVVNPGQRDRVMASLPIPTWTHRLPDGRERRERVRADALWLWHALRDDASSRRNQASP
jgi:hypothetical protein